MVIPRFGRAGRPMIHRWAKPIALAACALLLSGPLASSQPAPKPPAAKPPASSLPLPSQPLTRLDITSDTLAFKDRELKLAKLTLQVSYQPLTPAERQGNPAKPEEANRPNLTYKLFNNGKLQLTESVSTSNFLGQISLLDLDNNLSPEAVVKTFSGGTHCCTTVRLYSAKAGTYQKAVTLEGLDGNGGEFKDLDGNGSWEFVGSDNAFLYAFSGYAQSFPPSKILAWSNGNLINVTRRYPQELRSRAWQMFQTLEEIQQGGTGLSNHGLLAGYVAQKTLLGEHDAAWKLMLSRYNPKDPPKDFPTVLKAFLVRQGYL